MGSEEFKEITEYIFSTSSSLSELQFAYDTLVIWRTRMLVDASIEATLFLLNARINYVKYREMKHLDYTSLQGIFCSAITSCVNLLVESRRTKGQRATMTEIASSLGINKYIVYLRNQASHGERPSLEELYRGCCMAFKYLLDSYWQERYLRSKSLINSRPNNEDISSALNSYKSSKVILLVQDSILVEEEKLFHRDVMNINLKKIEEVLDREKKRLIYTLPKNNNIFPTEVEMMTLYDSYPRWNSREGTPNYIPSIQDLPELPKLFELVWTAVFCLIHENDAIPLLIDGILKSVETSPPLIQKWKVAFVLKILKLYYEPNSVPDPSPIKEIFRYKGLVFNPLKLAYSAARYACKYSILILDMLLSHHDISINFKQKVIELVKIKVGASRNLSRNLVAETKRIHTVEDLLRAKNSIPNEGTSIEASRDSNFRMWPIGHIIDEQNSGAVQGELSNQAVATGSVTAETDQPEGPPQPSSSSPYASQMSPEQKPRLKILITGFSSNIPYMLLYPICKGDVFGFDQTLEIHLYDTGVMIDVMNDIASELTDCAFPLVKEVKCTFDEESAFKHIDAAIFIKGILLREDTRKKDIQENVKMFKRLGKALDQFAPKTVKVLVAGSSSNTNTLICSKYAKSIPRENFSSLSRLDQNRAAAQIAQYLNTKSEKVSKIIIWGSCSTSRYPDVYHGKVIINDEIQNIEDAVRNDAYLQGEFINIIQKRTSFSPLSTTTAICDHMRDWFSGTAEGNFVSMGVISDGSYDTPPGIIYSFPVTIGPNKKWTIFQGLAINNFSREKMNITGNELLKERVEAFSFCQD